jgi:secreted trypsin-like serine protease
MRKSIIVLSILVLMLVVVTPVLAITYGQADGDLHPFVGALVGTFNDQSYPYCSGTLISPTVFLTAAHCDIGHAAVYVTFEEQYTADAELHSGTFYGNPLYSQKQNDPHDIAVVVFDEPINGLTPAQLPTLGQFDKLPKDQKFTSVGYGGQEAVNQPGGPVIGYLDQREYSVGTLNAINPAWLRISQNPARGDGGTCYGDSGGPNFLGADAGETNIVAALTVTGDTFCRATNVTYRTDTASAREFLSAFVALP